MEGLILMAIIVQNALDSAFDEVALLNVEAFREYSQALSLEDWKRMEANLSKVAEMAKVGQLIVARQDDLLVGSVIYCPPGTSDSRIFQPEWASLRLLAVSPQRRGEGIGQQLTLDCIQRARQESAAVMAIHTSELMVAAQRMYERLGFTRERELPRHFGLQYWRYVLALGG